MKFKWEANTPKRWQIWEGFSELIALCESVDGPDINLDWLLDELETVGELGLSGEFVNLYQTGRKHKNPNNSTLAYFLGITDEEPSSYPSGMEVSQGRKSPPDIDLDFEDRYRDKVIQYTRDKYGQDHCAQISTFSELGAKKAVRDICRVLDLPYELGDKISKAMPPPVFGVFPSLEDCMENQEFRDIYNSDSDAQKIIDEAKLLEGLWRDAGVHAAALVVADAPITDYVPVLQRGDEAPIVTQWDMGRIEARGLLKIDFLGLRNLSVISRCVENIKKNRGIDIGDPYDLVDLDDESVYQLLRDGDNIGVFQMEGSGFRELMLDVQPSGFDDIAAMLALYRPGPMGSNIHREYAARKNGRRPVKILHKKLEPILSDTYGLLLYQDQLLNITKDLASFSTLEADEMRKVVGKKLVEKMPEQKEKFITGCIKNGIEEHIAKALFAEIEHHASYSFNAAHAYAYGFISYITAYLKANYTIEYMAALLSSSSDNTDRIRLYLDECRRIGIPVVRPSINDSDMDFSIKDGKIVYGLQTIAGVGESSMIPILKDREKNGPYSSITEFVRKSSPFVLNRKVAQSLLRSGALDPVIDLPPVEDISRVDRIKVLFEESDQVGVFLGDHPFADLQDLVLDQVTTDIRSLRTSKADQWVKVAGLITSLTKRTTKAGRRMFNLIIEDQTDAVEVLVFPNAAQHLDEVPFEKGELLIVEGKATLDSEADTAKVNLIYNSHTKIDFSNISGSRPIVLESNSPLSTSKLEKIHDIIDKNKGKSNVILKARTQDGQRIILKFDNMTSSSCETVLKKILEV